MKIESRQRSFRMMPTKQYASAAVFVLLALMPTFALAQRGGDGNAGKSWDPIQGFLDGDVARDSTTSGGRPSSPWSFPQSPHYDPSKGHETPATIGAIVFSSAGRHCGGMFRAVAC
jgi:hypothetical protein